MDWKTIVTILASIASCISAVTAIWVFIANNCFNKKARRPWLTITCGKIISDKNKQRLRFEYKNVGLNPLANLRIELIWINTKTKENIEIQNPIGPGGMAHTYVNCPYDLSNVYCSDDLENKNLLVMRIKYEDPFFNKKYADPKYYLKLCFEEGIIQLGHASSRDKNQINQLS